MAGPLTPVVDARLDHGPHFNAKSRIGADVMASFVTLEDQSVGDHDHAAGGGELGLDHQRTRQVAPAHVELGCGLGRPVPCVRVGKAAEDRRRVEARKAQPVDGSFAADQGGGVAVRQLP